MKREDILSAAAGCVTGQRATDYGQLEDNFQIIANMWTDYLIGRGQTVDISTMDVAAMMALLKIARISTGTATADSWVDLAGYAACGGELATE